MTVSLQGLTRGQMYYCKAAATNTNSNNCAGPVVGGVKVFFSFIPGHSYSRHVHLYTHTDIYTVMLIVWMVKVVFDVLWSFVQQGLIRHR